jgi:hypothetical protein
MPADHHDARDGQLEALRRHMVHPDTRWEPPAGLGLLGEHANVEAGPPPRRRPSRSWLVVTGLLVAAALVGGVLLGAAAWSDARAAGGTGAASPAAASRAAEAPAVAPSATPECKTAVDRANAMLASAVKVRGALAEHDRVLNDPANRDLSVAEVRGKLAVSEQAGAAEAARFDRALDEYRQVVDRCGLRLP